MNQWAFVAAAYAVALIATAALLLFSYMSMRSAEVEAEKLRERR